MIPNIIEKFEQKIQEVVLKSIELSLAKIKTEVTTTMMSEIKQSQLQSEAQMWCESERLENYNRRDNVKIFGVDEQWSHVNGRTYGEDNEASMKNVISIAIEVGAKVEMNDISIAHRIPTRKQGAKRPIIVRFSRRVAKVNLMKSKRRLQDSQIMSGVKVYEDVTAPRLRFMKMSLCVLIIR